jgi:hypothetical protein
MTIEIASFMYICIIKNAMMCELSNVMRATLIPIRGMILELMVYLNNVPYPVSSNLQCHVIQDNNGWHLDPCNQSTILTSHISRTYYFHVK